MKHIKLLPLAKILALVLCAHTLWSCSKDDSPEITEGQRTFGIFKVLEDDTTVEMNGDIDGKIIRNFDLMIKAFPKAKKIIMKDCPGSADDEANLKVSQKMHNLGFSFHLEANSVIASGAVDMYVGGVKRTRAAGSKIGVHSWGSDPEEPKATEYPKGHAVHLPYINYYKAVGFTQQEAEDFYYFTLAAADAEDIHWMTDQEIEKYKVTKH